MRLIVTDLTRMQRGYICVAGLDAQRGGHVRPVLGTGRLPTNLLAKHGGPFDLATLVDLGPAEPVPTGPEVEDREFSPRIARSLGPVEPAEFWAALDRAARPTLRAIFGPELRRRGRGAAAVDADAGSASLGCLRPSGRPELYVTPREGGHDQVRMKLGDADFDLDLGVTDIRLYGRDYVTPDRAVVDHISGELANGTPVLLSVGLTRPFAKSPDTPPLHWLQINNVHLERDPTWRLGAESGLRRLVRLIFDF